MSDAVVCTASGRLSTRGGVVAAALAPTVALLLVGRVVAGAGAAAILAPGVATATTAFHGAVRQRSELLRPLGSQPALSHRAAS
ncbi:hypothetical protein [Brevibacterium antiquum]|uniref:hypothetical protein n=1 Tax=Brevibacterium antiquum TaxID=234835 RepID=UPI002FCD115C